MNTEEIPDYCISNPTVTESFPFNDTALVFKVAGFCIKTHIERIISAIFHADVTY